VASLSQGRTAAAQCGLFTHKSVPVIFEPPCTLLYITVPIYGNYLKRSRALNGFPRRVKLETYFYLRRNIWFLDYSKMQERKCLSETFRAERERQTLAAPIHEELP